MTLLKALRTEKRPLALLAALALVFNMLLAGTAQAAHSFSRLKADTPFGISVLCTAAGEGLAPDSRHAPAEGQCPCAAACLTSACCGSLAAAPEAEGEHAFTATPADFPFPHDGPAKSGGLPGLASARAPPSL